MERGLLTCATPFAVYLHFQRLAGFQVRFRQVAHADPFPEGGGIGGAGQLSELLAAFENFAAGPWHAAAGESDAGQPALYAFGFLPDQDIPGGKLSLVQADHPVVIGFVGGMVVVHIDPVQQVARLQAQVSRAPSPQGTMP